MNNLINEKIREIRERKNFSQENMAEHLNISQSAYAKIEKGTTKIDLDRFMAISKILDVEPTELLHMGESKVVNFNNCTSTYANIENFYSNQYDKRLKNLEDEIFYLRQTLEKQSQKLRKITQG